MTQLKEYEIRVLFTKSTQPYGYTHAEITWKLTARSAHEAHARAWEIVHRLIESGEAEAILGTDAEVFELAVMPTAEKVAA